MTRVTVLPVTRFEMASVKLRRYVTGCTKNTVNVVYKLLAQVDLTVRQKFHPDQLHGKKDLVTYDIHNN